MPGLAKSAAARIKRQQDSVSETESVIVELRAGIKAGDKQMDIEDSTPPSAPRRR